MFCFELYLCAIKINPAVSGYNRAPKIEEIIDNDAKDARILSVKGTPTVFVNEKKLERLSQKDLFDLVESEIYK